MERHGGGRRDRRVGSIDDDDEELTHEVTQALRQYVGADSDDSDTDYEAGRYGVLDDDDDDDVDDEEDDDDDDDIVAHDDDNDDDTATRRRAAPPRAGARQKATSAAVDHNGGMESAEAHQFAFDLVGGDQGGSLESGALSSLTNAAASRGSADADADDDNDDDDTVAAAGTAAIMSMTSSNLGKRKRADAASSQAPPAKRAATTTAATSANAALPASSASGTPLSTRSSGTPRTPARRSTPFGPGVDDIFSTGAQDDSELSLRPNGRRRASRRRSGGLGDGRGGRRRRGQGGELPPQLSKLMGEANMLFISKQYDRAIPILREVIRQAPTTPEPYNTLGLIYEEIGDKKKAINFYILAAINKPKDAALWKRVAEMSHEQGNLDQALHCYTVAARIDPDDSDTLWNRGCVQEQLGDYRKAARTLEKLNKRQPQDPAVCSTLARIYMTLHQLDAAIVLLEGCVLACNNPAQLDLSVINMLTELYIASKSYKKVSWTARERERERERSHRSHAHSAAGHC